MSISVIFYIVTWAVIVLNYVIIFANHRLLRKSWQQRAMLARDLMHMSILATAARTKLHEVDPNAYPEIPEETHRWIQEKHLEYLVFHDEQ